MFTYPYQSKFDLFFFPIAKTEALGYEKGDAKKGKKGERDILYDCFMAHQHKPQYSAINSEYKAFCLLKAVNIEYG